MQKEFDHNNHHLEIVAPAGDVSALVSAVKFGADAVYFGLKEFTARMRADNFSIREAQDALHFLHEKGKKGYLALNILFKNDEINRLIEMLADIAQAGFDGVIIQDLGLYRLIHTYFPSIPLHASTQMVCYTLDGALQLQEMGFKRVVLSRELTFDEIRDIRRGTRIELEVFVHGALCYCFSGLCLFSSRIGGRSGNRGQCAQPCRKPYRVLPGGEKRHLFSTNDICLADEVGRLREIGVDALKIEGRMKGPYYAGAVSSLYRQLLDGTLLSSDEARTNLKIIYSRDFVEDYFGNRRARITQLECPGNIGLPIGRIASSARGFMTFRTSHSIELRDGLQLFRGKTPVVEFSLQHMKVGGKKAFSAPAGAVVSVRCDKKAERGDQVYLVSSQKLKQRYALTRADKIIGKDKVPVDIDVMIDAEGMHVGVAAHDIRDTYRFDVPVTASQKAGLTAAIMRTYFSRLGTTEFELRGFSARIPDNVYVPPAVLNDVRRELIHRFREKIGDERNALVQAVSGSAERELAAENYSPARGLRWSVKVDRIEYLDMLPADQFDRICIDAGCLTGPDVPWGALAKYQDALIIAMPALRVDGTDYGRLIDECVGRGFSRWQAQNIGDIHLFKKKGVPWHADYPLYCLNGMAGRQLIDMGALTVTASPEDDLSNLCANRIVCGDRGEVIVYQDTPLFVSKICAYKEMYGCASPAHCPRETMEIQNDEGDRFLVLNKECVSVVMHARPFCISQEILRLRDAGIGRCRIDFCFRRYDKARISYICDAVRKAKRVDESQTGNYARQLI